MRPDLTRARGTRAAALLGAAAVVVGITFVACGDPYLHTNPYYPAFPVEIAISGPDTLFSFSQLASYSAQITPAFPDTAIEWATSDSDNFAPSGPATFRANSVDSLPLPLYPKTLAVGVMALIGREDTTLGINSAAVRSHNWTHVATKNVILTQRVVRIQLRCPDTHACDTLAAGAAWSVWVDGFDALGYQIVTLVSATANPATGTPIATFVARDTTVASVSPVGIRAATVTALKSGGSTWIVATRDSLRDSLQIVVR
jgi:hypothetical protein